MCILSPGELGKSRGLHTVPVLSFSSWQLGACDLTLFSVPYCLQHWVKIRKQCAVSTSCHPNPKPNPNPRCVDRHPGATTDSHSGALPCCPHSWSQHFSRLHQRSQTTLTKLKISYSRSSLLLIKIKCCQAHLLRGPWTSQKVIHAPH